MHEIRVSERVCACVFEEYVCCIILLFCPVNFHTHMLPSPPIPFDDNDNSDDHYQRCDNVFPLFYFSSVFEHVIHTHTLARACALARSRDALPGGYVLSLERERRGAFDINSPSRVVAVMTLFMHPGSRVRGISRAPHRSY